MENQSPTPRHGGISSRTGSPAPPPSKFQPLATSAPSSSALSSIMRPIRTHVRIMGYPSAFSHDGSSKRLTVKNLTKNKIAPPAGSTYNNAVAEDDTAPTTSATTDDSSDNSAVVYRVHEYGETIEKFFEEVVAPGIEASLSGQSVTYLLVGPPNSGKSQTMYGDNKNIKGLVGLAAEKLLHAMNVNPRVLTTFGNFMTVGDHIQDLSKPYAYSPEVPIKDFPAPLGKMALPGISVLQDAKTCVQMSRDRNAQSSTFAQFHVYKDISPNTQDGGASTPADSLGGQSSTASAQKKGTFATVTFVDLAAFCDAGSSPYESKFITNKDSYEQYVQGHDGDLYTTSPELRTYPKDLIHFHRVIDSLNAGNDGDFSRTILSTLAQQFLVGPSTLVAIGTLTGVDTLHSKTMATLRFLEKLSKIHQLQALITTVQPSWLEKSVTDINHRLSQREELLGIAKEKAMSDAYRSFRSALGKVVGGYNRFNGVLDTTATVRLAVATQQENLDAELSSLIEQKKHRLQGMESNWKNTQSTNSHETEELKRIYAEIEATTAKTQGVEKDTISYISACKDRLADLSTFEDKFVKLERNRNGLQDNINSAVTRLSEVDSECKLVMKGLNYIGEYQQNLSNKLEAELDLQDASARAAGQPVENDSRSRRNNRSNAGDDELAVATADFVELATEIEELCGTSCMTILSSKGIRVTSEMESALNAAGIQTKAPPKPPMFHTSGTGSVPRRPSTSTGAVRAGRYADPTISSSPQAHPHHTSPSRQQGSTFRNSTSFSPGNKVRSAAASFVRTVSNLKGSLFSGGGGSTVPGSRTSSISPPPMTPPRATDRYSAGGPSFSGNIRNTTNGPRSRANTAPSPSSVAIRSVRTAPTHHAAEEEEDDDNHHHNTTHTTTTTSSGKHHHVHDVDQPSIDMMFTGGGGAAEYESEIIMVGGLTTRNSHLPLGGVTGRKRSRTDTTDESARSCRSEDDDDYESVESDEEESAEYDSDDDEEEESPSPKARRRKAAPKRASTASSARSSKASTRKSAPATKGSKKKAPASKKASSTSKSTSRSATPVAAIRSRAKAPSKSTSAPKASKSKSARR